jgi:hypothetical protein
MLASELQGVRSAAAQYPPFSAMAAVVPELNTMYDGFNTALFLATLSDGTSAPVRAWTDVLTKRTWLLLLSGSGADRSWCFSSGDWTSAGAINEQGVLRASVAHDAAFGAPSVGAPSKHRFFHSLAAFSGIRVYVSGSSFTSFSLLSGVPHLLDFAFGGAPNTAERLMFTTENYLSAGPDLASWLRAFGADRGYNPSFERNGDCGNSALPCRARFSCGQPVKFGYQTAEISSGMATNGAYCGGAGTCGFAHGDWMGQPAAVLVFGELAAGANVTLLSPLSSAA